MTTQEHEKIEYRGKEYQLYGTPLAPFIEANKIELGIFTTSHWRGYQGYWKIDSDKLYIKDIECDKSFGELFGTEIPVLADWYTGAIEYGIGSFKRGFRGSIVYETFVWMWIENGIVKDKKITKEINDDYTIKRGRYRNLDPKQVLVGKITSSTQAFKSAEFIKEYLQDVLDFFTDKNHKLNIETPKFDISDDDIELAKRVQQRKIHYFITRNYIAISSMEFRENSVDDDCAAGISKLLEKIISADFSQTYVLGNEGNDISNVSNLLNPDIEHIARKIRKTKSFCLNPRYIGSSHRIYQIKTITTNRLNNYVFEYYPVIENFDYKFSDKVISLNKEKFETINKVIYSQEQDTFFLNLPEETIMNLFGHYLDEDYVEPSEEDEYDFISDYKQDLSDEELEAGDWEYDRENPGHDPSENPYIDLFGPGDEANDAYWNTD